MTLKLLFIAVLGLLVTLTAAQARLTADDIQGWRAEPADAVFPYGPGETQLAELRLPAGASAGLRPVVVVIHGGCWLAEYDRTHVGRLSAALAKAGFAVWTLEYRRLGEPGGGWPGTFNDVGDGIEALRKAAVKYPLDLSRVVLIGHSSGGQLALWYAGAGHLPASSAVHRAAMLPVRGVVALAAMTDLAAPETSCGDLGLSLIGGKDFLAERGSQASPRAMVPLGVPQRLVHGMQDNIVPLQLSRTYAKAARAAGDDIKLVEVPGAGHFELIDPEAGAWSAVLAATQELIGSP